MLTLDEYKKILGDTGLTDQELEQFRNSLYSLIDNVLDSYYEAKTRNN